MWECIQYIIYMLLFLLFENQDENRESFLSNVLEIGKCARMCSDVKEACVYVYLVLKFLFDDG